MPSAIAAAKGLLHDSLAHQLGGGGKNAAPDNTPFAHPHRGQPPPPGLQPLASDEQSTVRPLSALKGKTPVRDRKRSVAPLSPRRAELGSAALMSPQLDVQRSFAGANSLADEESASVEAGVTATGGSMLPQVGRIEWYVRAPNQSDDPSRPNMPMCLADGVKTTYTTEEMLHFAKTPYAQGRQVYSYEGGLKHVRKEEAPKVPPGGSHNPLYAERHSSGEPFSVLTYPEGDYYEGDWRSGMRHGLGTLRTAGGYRYRGEWKDDYTSGKGEEEFTHQEVVRSSCYHNLRPSREGVILYQPHELGTSYRYQGGMKNGKRHGEGKIFYENGDVFVGYFKDGKRHGVGRITYGKDKRSFECEYVNDELKPPIKECTASSLISPTGRQSVSLGVTSEEVQAPAACLAPADLTKWRVREGVTELSLEHFHRLKAGFELLDDEGNGELRTSELNRIWGNKDRQMLLKLDRDGNGGVDLYEIMLEWYPHVPTSQLLRFVELEPHLQQIHRMRGMLADVRHSIDDGFYSLTGGRETLPEADLERAGFNIAGDLFSLTLYRRAAALRDPPGFQEVLIAWYPNTPRGVLERFEMARLPYAELDVISQNFAALQAHGMSNVLNIEAFREARRQHRVELGREAKRKTKGLDASSSSPGRGRATTLSPTASIDVVPLMRRIRPYFFRGEPCWPLGRHIRVTVPMLEQVADTWAGALLSCIRPRRAGVVHLLQLLRYTFPNVSCLRTQELLDPESAMMGCQPEHYVPALCSCDICDYARYRGINDPALGGDGGGGDEY
eukprot:Hpha_TRINITY_DN30464_c0_g1::TRINITY_DN30464_c0_g1_i1::g.167975::m.167975